MQDGLDVLYIKERVWSDMLTELGKQLRILRLDYNEILKDMATKLNVTSAYLSAIENGKRMPTQKIMDSLTVAYALNAEQKERLMDAFYKTIDSISIDLSSQRENQRNLGLVFARKFDGLSDEQVEKLIKILNKEE